MGLSVEPAAVGQRRVLEVEGRLCMRGAWQGKGQGTSGQGERLSSGKKALVGEALRMNVREWKPEEVTEPEKW